MSFIDSFFCFPLSAITANTLFSMFAIATPICILCALIPRQP